MSNVPSVLPESTTTISSAQATASRQARRFAASFLAMRMTESLAVSPAVLSATSGHPFGRNRSWLEIGEQHRRHEREKQAVGMIQQRRVEQAVRHISQHQTARGILLERRAQQRCTTPLRVEKKQQQSQADRAALRRDHQIFVVRV